jgi:anti-sigma B factor antagonist
MAEESQTAWKASLDQERGMVLIEGEVDFTNSLDVRDWLQRHCQETPGDLHLDLSRLSYIDSSGLAVLIEIRKHLKATNRVIRIEAVSGQVQKLFTLTQLGELFGI